MRISHFPHAISLFLRGIHCNPRLCDIVSSAQQLEEAVIEESGIASKFIELPLPHLKLNTISFRHYVVESDVKLDHELAQCINRSISPSAGSCHKEHSIRKYIAQF